MKKKNLLLSIFYLNICYANVTLKGNFINNTKHSFVALQKFSNTLETLSTIKLNNNSFSVELSKMEPGIYRLQLGLIDSKTAFNIIINGTEKQIAFDCVLTENNFQLEFLISEENKALLEYEKKVQNLYQKKEIEYFFLQNYPEKKSKIYQKIQTSFHENTKNIQLLKTHFLKKNSSYFWASATVQNKAQKELLLSKKDKRIVDYEQQEHFWEQFPKPTKKLINSPIYREQIVAFFQYYYNTNLELNNEEFISEIKKGIDQTILFFQVDVETKKAAILFLYEGFKEINQTEMMEYLEANFSKTINEYVLLNEQQKNTSNLNSQKLNLAPNIFWKTNSSLGSPTNLYEIEAQKTILVFWSSECEHCLQMMPLLDQWNALQKNTKILAIGIENNRENYTHKAMNYKNLIHFSDFLGWNSPIANEYKIEALPTFYVLDKDKKIIQIYTSFNELIQDEKSDY